MAPLIEQPDLAAEPAVTVAAEHYRATVLSAGGGLGALTHHGVDLVRGTPPGEVVSAGRGQVLMPWPNRLRDGQYSFAGSEQQLALSEPDRHNAIHGLVRWCTWRPLEVAADAVTMGYRLCAQRGYPWTIDVAVRYRVSAGGLGITLSATNRSSTPAPFAAGMHPYLDVGVPLDQACLQLPAATHLLSDDRMLPCGTEPVSDPVDFRERRPLAGRTLDDGFTDLARNDDGHVVVRLRGPERAVELWADRSFGWLQAYTGDDLGDAARLALAVEPMSAPADAFRSGDGLVRLQPGQEWTGRFGIRAASVDG